MEISKDKIRSCANAFLIASVLMLAALGVKSLLPSRGKEAAPPVPVVDVQDVSSAAWADFRAKWIAEHLATADKADQYKSWQEAFDDAGTRLEPLYPDSFRPLGKSIKSSLYGAYDDTDPTQKPPAYDSAKLRETFTKAAKGAK